MELANVAKYDADGGVSESTDQFGNFERTF
jgi:hypothetical protein